MYYTWQKGVCNDENEVGDIRNDCQREEWQQWALHIFFELEIQKLKAHFKSALGQSSSKHGEITPP